MIIRAHKRYAVRRKACLSHGAARAMDGLLIELSLDGCRVSTADEQRRIGIGDVITVHLEGEEPLEGCVRWLGDKVLGLRFVRPLHVSALDRLIRACRGEIPPQSQRRAYGT